MYSPLPKSSVKPSLRRPSVLGSPDSTSTPRLRSVLKPKNPPALKKGSAPKFTPALSAVPASAPAPNNAPSPAPALRPEDRRRTRRRMINRMAKIQFGAGTAPRDCMINDISAGGVRLRVEGFEVPDAFVLFLTGDGVTRECVYRVVWRLGPEIGAAFVRFVKRPAVTVVR